MEYGKMIFLNGPSSAGKSTLSWELQERSEEKYYWLSNDAFTDMVHNKYYDMDWGKNHHEAVEMMYKAVKLYLECGNNVILDHVMFGQDYEELIRFAELLSGIRVIFVQVLCDREELERREKNRGDRRIGQAVYQLERQYDDRIYDIKVNTSVNTTAECAEILLKFMGEEIYRKDGKSAFERLIALKGNVLR